MKRIQLTYFKLSHFILVAFAFLILPYACVDPITPEFDFQDNILFIDAYALSKERLSTVSIKRSLVNNESFSVLDVDNAKVEFENMDSGEIITCSQNENGTYSPPEDFKVNEGETWKLKIELEDGRQFESEPEYVNPAVPIDNISATFDEELYFDEGFDKFVPGHSVQIDWTDPVGEKNYYLWRYRSYEPLIVCLTCTTGRYRNGECQIESPFWRGYVDYLCYEPCWQIRFSNRFKINEDRLFDGQQLTGQAVANIPFYRRQSILVEMQQMALTEAAYNYFSIIDDISNESGGLNAPPPAALKGNIYAVNSNSEDVVLGQFVASGVATKTIFIDREDLGISAITPDPTIQQELCTPCPDSLLYFPCLEGDFRTAVKHEDWPF